MKIAVIAAAIISTLALGACRREVPADPVTYKPMKLGKPEAVR